MNAFTLAPRRRKPLVILKSLELRDQSLYRPTFAPGDVLRFLRRAIAFIFGPKVSMAVAYVLIAAMWWHLATITDNIAAGEQVATDCLYALPWGIVWAYRSTRMPMPEDDNFTSAKKGGRA